MTGRTPELGIGLPVYNGERYLAESLESLLGQTYGDYELIIADNASTDGTEEIARSFAARDPRIRYVRHDRNLGAGGNFSFACRASESVFFKWATSDDLHEPTHLERCMAAIREHPDAILAYTKCRKIGASGEPLGDYDDNLDLPWPDPVRRYTTVRRGLALCNVQYGVMRAALLRRTRLMGSYPGSDIVMIEEMSLYGTFHEVPERLFLRRFHEDASSSIGSAEEIEEFYAPGGKRRVRRDWRHLKENLWSILRAPLPFGTRARLLRFDLGQAIRARHTLWRELWSPHG